SWPGGCGCNGNSLFYRDCGQAVGACLPPGVNGDPADYCGLACVYAYHYEIRCLDVEMPCPTCQKREAPSGSSPPSGPNATMGPAAAGEPVSLTTGAMSFTHTDAVVGELAFSRTFNSLRVSDATRHGVFGPGWNASFEARLVAVSPKLIAAR